MTENPRVRIIPLGGVDEIGKNMTVFEFEDDIVVVDCGLIFPREDMLGIDLVIPDITYLQRNYHRIRAYVITHGHEDHIGATPYVLQQAPAPVFGTRLTIGLVEMKLKEHKVDSVPLHVVKAGDVIRVGKFQIQFIKVCHSIAGAVALAITTPAGTILHTGDFKIDHTPVDGEATDLSTIAQFGNRGLLALLADSTNIERSGFTMTERKVSDTLTDLLRGAEGRVVVATFASNISRIQMVVDAAMRFHRVVCIVGRSMINYTKLAIHLGELHIPEGRQIDMDDLDRYHDHEIVVITTGSQGEPMSGLMRMAFGEHRKVRIRQSDLVILSSSVVPGNERLVSRMINQLYRSGATVIYESLAEVHVSGHACQEELKMILSLTKPQYFIPVHGEYRHLCQHVKLAQRLGIDKKRTIVPELGGSLSFPKKAGASSARFPPGA